MIGVDWIFNVSQNAIGPMAAVTSALNAADNAATQLDATLSEVGSAATGAATGIGGLTDNLNDSFEQVTNSVTDYGFKFEQANAKAANSTNMLTGMLYKAAAATAALFAVNKIQDYGQEVYDTGKKLETLDNVINYTSGNVQEAAKNHDFLKRMIGDYKLPLVETTEGYSQFNAALMGSELAGQKARDIYEGVSIGVTAMHLPAAQANQVFTALNQMVSKGTVQAQELKLQLGNALPGAFQLAAKAMGLTTEEFTKQMEAGEIMANDFLPKFAAAMKEKYSGAIPAAIESTIAKETEYHNKSIELQDEIFENLQPVINAWIDLKTAALEPVGDAIIGILQAGAGMVSWLQEHEVLIKTTGIFLGFMALAYLAANTEMIIAAVSAGAMEAAWLGAFIVTEALTAAQWALNLAMSMNPIGLVVLTIGALVASFYAAWETSEEFRGVVMGTWEALKVLAVGIFDLAINPFVAWFKIIAETGSALKNLFTGNLDGLKENASNMMQIIEDANPIDKFKKMGADARNAFDNGYQDGVDSYTADQTAGDGQSVLSQLIPGGKSTTDTAKTTGGNDTSTSKSGGGSGNGTRNINVRNDKLAEVHIHVKELRDSANGVRNFINETAIAALRDWEVAIS